MSKSLSLSVSMVAVAVLSVAAFASVSDAQAASCAKFGKVKSKNSNTPVTVTFVNRSGEYRSVMWVDFGGTLVNYANLNPGQSFTINTYVTHPWVFTDGPGNCVKMFMPRKGVPQFNLTARATGEGGD